MTFHRSTSSFCRDRALVLAALTAAFVPAQALGDEAPSTLRVELAPFPEAGPFKRRLVWTSAAEQEVVLDRRLLAIRVRPAEGRARECRHPDAPTRTPEARLRRLAPGQRVEEWVDLRTYCTGRARASLLAGPTTLELRYGFRRGGARRWILRDGAGERTASVVGLEHAFAPPPVPEAAQVPAPDAVAVSLANTTARGVPTFTVRLRGEGVRVYPRRDLFRFRVRGPLGEVECRPRRQPVVPIRDFYRRLGRWQASMSARWACPEGTFSVPGLYEVVPVVDLVYDGTRHGYDAVTGTFEGAPATVRRTGGSYVQQRPGDLLGVLRAGS
ncbi:MAG: hypothetical protein AAF447_02355 [Myxococcota bacterium]